MSDRLALRASYEERSADDCLKGSEDVLAVFEFGRSPLASSDPRHVPVALAQLDSPPRCEVWRGDGPIKTGTWDGLELDDELRDRIRKAIRRNTTPRHVPAKIVQVAGIPRTVSGK
ncbi:MAG: hypothetical protein KJO33_06870, partial [Gammaproteobacteria bacterium]|nr:hypothetical protein [Gammaproteobacteria bacterium]